MEEMMDFESWRVIVFWAAIFSWVFGLVLVPLFTGQSFHELVEHDPDLYVIWGLINVVGLIFGKPRLDKNAREL